VLIFLLITDKELKTIFEAFGDALSEIPAAICDNAGLDTAKIMIGLEELHASDDENSYKWVLLSP